MKFFHLNHSRKVSHRHLVLLVGVAQFLDGLVCTLSGTLINSRLSLEAARYLSRRRIDDLKHLR